MLLSQQTAGGLLAVLGWDLAFDWMGFTSLIPKLISSYLCGKSLGMRLTFYILTVYVISQPTSSNCGLLCFYRTMWRKLLHRSLGWGGCLHFSGTASQGRNTTSQRLGMRNTCSGNTKTLRHNMHRMFWVTKNNIIITSYQRVVCMKNVTSRKRQTS